MDKKKFQKIIGQIRTQRNSELDIRAEYPKAMMTSKQETISTATVNCGGEWGIDSKGIADYVMKSQAFTELMEASSAKAEIEKVEYPGKSYVQIRIRW